jgi:hypothetical protein
MTTRMLVLSWIGLGIPLRTDLLPLKNCYHFQLVAVHVDRYFAVHTNQGFHTSTSHHKSFSCRLKMPHPGLALVAYLVQSIRHL